MDITLKYIRQKYSKFVHEYDYISRENIPNIKVNGILKIIDKNSLSILKSGKIIYVQAQFNYFVIINIFTDERIIVNPDRYHLFYKKPVPKKSEFSKNPELIIKKLPQ